MGNVLLVEGKDDANVFKNLCSIHDIRSEIVVIPRRLNATPTISIIDQNGIDRLLENIEAYLVGSEIECLGIVIDADISVQDRWQSLRNRLISYGYSSDLVPTSPNADGTIVAGNSKPTVGVWIMPNNVVPGTLENFVQFLVPSGDPLWGQVENCIEQIPSADLRFVEANRIKAQIHTWLAWQAEPGKPMGLAVTFRYLDANAPYAHRFVNWIRQVFSLT